MIPRIRVWSRRKFALYLAATFLGVAVLVALIALLGLLYWMDARVPLPPEAALRPPAAVASLSLRGALADLPAPVLDAALAGAPIQADLLIRQAVRAKRCPAQLLTAALPPPATGPVLALSLGRYPGRFHLVRRDLERRTARGRLPFSLRYHRGKTLFLDPAPEDRLPVLALVRCTLLRGADAAGVEGIIDGLVTAAEKGAPPPETPAQGFAGSAECRFLGRLPLRPLLAPKAHAAWDRFSGAFDSALGDSWTGRLTLSARAESAAGPVRLTLTAAPADAALAERLRACLTAHAATLGLAGGNVLMKNGDVIVTAALDY